MNKFSFVIVAAGLVVSSLFSMQAVAQISFGVKAGATFSNFKGDMAEESKTGLVVGGLAAYNFTEKISAQLELLYTQAGARENGGSYDFSYINVPLVARYNVWNGLNVETGPQIGFLLSAKTKNSSGNKTDIKHLLNTTDFAWVIGAAYELPNGAGAGIRYTPGFSDISTNSDNIKNTAFQITLSYRLGKKSK